MSVISVRDIGTELVEVVFGFRNLDRQRVVLPKRYANVSDVGFTGRALAVLAAMGQRRP